MFPLSTISLQSTVRPNRIVVGAGEEDVSLSWRADSMQVLNGPYMIANEGCEALWTQDWLFGLIWTKF